MSASLSPLRAEIDALDAEIVELLGRRFGVVRRVAADKAAAVAARWPDAGVLAADTDVVLGTAILGKPRDAAEARAALASLSGRRHRVIGGVAVRGPGFHESFTVTTLVTLRPLTPAEIDWYVATGEPLDKAGSYAIQERGGVFVAGIEGSHSYVIGLPLAETVAALGRAGVALPWSTP